MPIAAGLSVLQSQFLSALSFKQGAQVQMTATLFASAVATVAPYGTVAGSSPYSSGSSWSVRWDVDDSTGSLLAAECSTGDSLQDDSEWGFPHRPLAPTSRAGAP